MRRGRVRLTQAAGEAHMLDSKEMEMGAQLPVREPPTTGPLTDAQTAKQTLGRRSHRLALTSLTCIRA